MKIFTWFINLFRRKKKVERVSSGYSHPGFEPRNLERMGPVFPIARANVPREASLVYVPSYDEMNERRRRDTGLDVLAGAAIGYAIGEMTHHHSSDSSPPSSSDYSGGGGQFDGGGASGSWDSDTSSGCDSSSDSGSCDSSSNSD